MIFKPHYNTVLLKRLNEFEEMKTIDGFSSIVKNVDLYQIIDKSPEEEITTPFHFEIGDIVTACATGTSIENEKGEKFILMNCNYITSKIDENK